MAIKMVREPSETPNINNIDDIVPMRYAYGNQNGYVIGKGTEISNTVNGLNFTVNSGRLVLQGVECDIDASGATITIDNIATKRYYTVYLEVNLGLNTATIKSKYDTATYPTVDTGDDLTENTTGIARLPLYRFIATSGVVSNVNKVVESVKYIDESFIKNVKVNNAAQADNATTSSNSNKVNNLEITKDENGVLKIGDVIIPQKKLLWSGDITAQNSIVLQEELNINDVLLIEWGIIPDNYGDASILNFVSTVKLNEDYKGFIVPFIQYNDGVNLDIVAPAISYNSDTKEISIDKYGDNTVSLNGFRTESQIDEFTCWTQFHNRLQDIHLKKIYKIIG